MTTPLSIVPAPALLSIDQVASILALHVRTIRGYVRSGALKATRIGKQYRIALSDLESFTGRPIENHDERVLAAGGAVQVSSVVTVEGVSAALAQRLTHSLMATSGGPRASGQSVAVSTTYEVEHDLMRILLSADLGTMRSILGLIDAVLERPAAAA